MCGISGVIAPAGSNWATRLVEDIVSYQNARGPDAHKVTTSDSGAHRIVLGHNRLSIIDPQPQSNQPFTSSDESAVLVFNGEIYNYREISDDLLAAGRQLRTASDSEVLLEAYLHWGIDALDRFIGMFAFAIWDRKLGRLVLARDRFGVKPLYYHADGKSLAFASTPGVIARWAGLAPNLEYVLRGLAYKYYDDDSAISPFAGLQALEPGHVLIARLGNGAPEVTTRRYYDLAERVAQRIGAVEAQRLPAVADELKALLDDACRLRLRSDVPVGMSLSGGLDSASIAAITGRQQSGLIAFSFGQGDDQASEGPLAAEAARAAGIEMRFVWPQGPAALRALFHATLRAQGAPFPHTSQMAQYAVFERARADGVTVLLGGQGGDEALMGYRKFFLFRLQEILRQRRYTALPGFAASIAQLAPALAAKAGIFWAERNRYQSGGTGMASSLNLPALTGTSAPVMTTSQTIRDRQIEDITRYSLPTLLRYEDRNSMGNSIESRLPFMDHRVVEYGIAMPVSAKLAHGFGKYALRRAMKGLVPDSIRLNRDKRGFDTRQQDWINGGLGDVIRDELREHEPRVRNYFAPGTEIETAFSNAALVGNPQALKEAISLIWLGDPVRWQPAPTAELVAG